MGLTHHPHGISSFGQTIYSSGSSPTLGKVYHVRKEADANYAEWAEMNYHKHYDSSESIQTTIEAAVALADDFDTIWVYPGEWVPVGTLAITQKHLKLLAADTGPFCGLSGTEIWQLDIGGAVGGTDVPVITLNGANNVEIAGFRIIPYEGSSTQCGISIGETTECKGTWVHDNILYNLEAAQASHIRMGSSGKEAQYTLIEDNFIYCGGAPGARTGMIDWVHATRSVIRNNTFMINSNQAAASCISVQHTAYMRGQILSNLFWGMAQGVDAMVCQAVLLDAQVVAGDLIIDNNHSANIAAPFASIVKDSNCLGLNYLNHSAIAST